VLAVGYVHHVRTRLRETAAVVTSRSLPQPQEPSVRLEGVDGPLPDGQLHMDGFARWILSAVSAQPQRVPYVRRQVAAVLHLWDLDDLAWPVELVVTELVANVVRHARTLFSVGLFWNGSVLHGEVSDANPILPEPALEVNPENTGGRGLLLIAEVADRWGVARHQRGKTVWFEVTAAR
jgi:hypothetical protein